MQLVGKKQLFYQYPPIYPILGGDHEDQKLLKSICIPHNYNLVL